MDGNQIVALLGIVLALFLVSQNSEIQSMPWSRRLKLGAIWAAIFTGLAIAANALIMLRS